MMGRPFSQQVDVEPGAPFAPPPLLCEPAAVPAF
jgi:hypothetical protein